MCDGHQWPPILVCPWTLQGIPDRLVQPGCGGCPHSLCRLVRFSSWTYLHNYAESGLEHTSMHA
ncbi:uncharacterized protein SETTUDRAFT_168438 [Exserohilum turcica Et28A]|uniref:Uncharacterized protein n=1 Tax=Exserohilum turcicum (strain 28A) TaxID=671987 RepID=R0KKY0_EXST2|nr:uncharacterized protein SETTUDRAFT_168438 [Exserohilum turcica Et28A]EOA88602.1 hypothetical protein SETTUDRAFT_168438 [Exserohilum turcica Et28A]